MNEKSTHPQVWVYRDTWEAPRWLGMESFLRNMAHMLNLEIELQVEKHLIRESGRYLVRGSKQKVDAFQQGLRDTLAAYNKEES